MRLFIGIPLDARVVDQLAAFTRRLQKAGEELRWSNAETWHITLQFLGSSTAEQLDCVTKALAAIRCGPVPIGLKGVGFFDRAGVFFVDVPPGEELQKLERQVKAATQPCGFAPEDRPYHPHLTLARSRAGGAGLRPLAAQVGDAPRFESFLAREFLLYESFPGPGGSRYEVRARFALR